MSGRHRPGAVCPVCGGGADGATPVEPGADPVPKPGDVSICIYCAAALVFTVDGVREATPAELVELSATTVFRVTREFVGVVAKLRRLVS